MAQTAMSDEAPNIVYGRLLEAAHLSGYGFERMTDELEWLLDGDRWQTVGSGYLDVNAFLRSIDLSAFNIAEKKKLHQRIRQLQPKASPESIGKATGTPRSTVRGHLGEGGESATIASPDQDRSTPQVADPPPFGQTSKDVADLSRRRSAGQTKRAEMRGKDLQARAIVPGGADEIGDRWTLLAGDVADRLADIADGSIDMIVTDPPYPAESLPLWSLLAEQAARVLVPQGIIVALSGKIFLPDVIARLTAYLAFGWVYCQPLPGESSRILARQVGQEWKPWLAFSNGPWPSGRIDWHGDMLHGTRRLKDRYHWQQTEQPAGELIVRLSPEGGLVLDPFCGTGTYGVAALRAGRHFIGVEWDAERHAKAALRLSEVAA
jgi:site-specific DNA-methyltransferase (adenine-specific)